MGNPGDSYKDTRHNTGFLVVEALSAKIRNSKSETLNKSKNLIFKSQNFMNESGSFVKKLTTDYRLPTTDLYVIHDDLDIPLGSYKIQFGRGPKDHNGLKSVDESLGTDQYWHVRVGVDNRMGEPHFAEALRGKEYVLQNFSDEERKILDETVKEVVGKLFELVKTQ